VVIGGRSALAELTSVQLCDSDTGVFFLCFEASTRYDTCCNQLADECQPCQYVAPSIVTYRRYHIVRHGIHVMLVADVPHPNGICLSVTRGGPPRTHDAGQLSRRSSLPVPGGSRLVKDDTLHPAGVICTHRYLVYYYSC